MTGDFLVFDFLHVGQSFMNNKRLNLGFYLCFALAASLLLSCGTKSVSTQSATPETLVSVDVEIIESETNDDQADNDAAGVNDAATAASSDKAQKGDLEFKDPDEGSDEQDGGDEEDIPGFIRCQAKVEIADTLYDTQAQAPTLEEARENAVEEACAISCSDKLAKLKSNEKKFEAAFDACFDKCTDKNIVVAVACSLDDESIYTEGAWSDTNDATPTNGEESTDVVDE